MTEQYTPTTDEVRDGYAYHEWDISQEEEEPRRQAFDSWLAEVERAAAEKAWDEGQAAEELAWEHAFNGHPVPEGEACDVCKVVNPYRKAVKS